MPQIELDVKAEWKILRVYLTNSTVGAKHNFIGSLARLRQVDTRHNTTALALSLKEKAAARFL
jgi:hypothetical protein